MPPPAIKNLVAQQTEGTFRKILGWIAVLFSAAVINLWTYWGIVENFHEGWYSTFLWENLAMLFIQYLLLTIAFCLLSSISIQWPLIGLLAHIAAALVLGWFFAGASFQVVGLLIVLPMLGLGLLYFWGRPWPKKWAFMILWILPLILILAVTPYKLYRVSQRVNDGNFGTRLVEGNGLSLIWAPRGPGFPESGAMTYEEAVYACKHLSQDGTMILAEEQNIWRLPTIEEAVASITLHGENAGGVWDPAEEKAHYTLTPDKETPLWDSHSQVIYYWLLTKADEDNAYILVYDGGVYSRRVDRKYAYLSFRAVKDP